MTDDAVACRVAELLAVRRLATAESFTAGRVATVLAAVEGASAWILGGLVAYQEQVKRDLLEVRASSVLTATAGAEMARGMAKLSGADVVVATTGVAGDVPEDGAPPGTIRLATLVGGDVRTYALQVDGSPDDVCRRGTSAALIAVCEHLAASA